jgi:hypothetical protein
MRCFFDGSQGPNDAGERWLTLAGITAKDKFFDNLEPLWDLMLKARYPKAYYIHMNPMYTFDEPFVRVMGWNEDKCNTLVQDAIQLLQNLDKDQFHAFVYSVDLEAHARIVSEGITIRAPAESCARLCVASAMSWHAERHADMGELELVHVLFDRGETFICELKKTWLRERTPKSQRFRSKPFWDWIEEMYDVDMQDHPAVQVADMLAWSRTRGLKQEIRPQRDLMRILTTIMPTTLMFLDEPKLRSLAELQAQKG